MLETTNDMLAEEDDKEEESKDFEQVEGKGLKDSEDKDFEIIEEVLYVIGLWLRGGYCKAHNSNASDPPQ
jgi:hypothetical protein